jgi:small-conductance mechanosensitive channel
MTPGGLAAQVPTAAPSTSEALTSSPVIPHLSDLIPRVGALVGRLAELETTLKGGSDLADLKNSLSEIDSSLKKDAAELHKLKTASIAGGGELRRLQSEIIREEKLLAGVIQSLREQVRALVDIRHEWVAEQEQWKPMRAALLTDKPIAEIKASFDKADHTIDTALGLILARLQPLLALQKQAAILQTKLNMLNTEVDSVSAPAQSEATVDVSPPMFSAHYVVQFLAALRSPLNAKLDQMVQDDRTFFAEQGWILFLQVVASLVLVLAVFRNRHQLAGSERWRFLAKRPIAAGLFAGLWAGVPFFTGMPVSFAFAYTVVAGIAMARLLDGLLDTGWRKHLVYGLTTLLILTRLFYTLDLATPLFRFYFLVGALLSLVFCLRWITQNTRGPDAPRYPWLFFVAAAILTVVVLTEVWGEAERAEYLFTSLLHTLFVLIGFWLLRYLMRGGLYWAVHRSFLQTIPLVRRNADGVVKRLALLMNVLLGVLLLTYLLWVWGVYHSPAMAFTELLAWSVPIGTYPLTVGHVIAGFSAVVIALLVSWLVKQLLIEDALGAQHVDRAVREAVAHLIHYGLIFLSFTIALTLFGIDLTHLTLLASALGIGVGLAARDLLACFFGGLMIYLDRPFAVGDWIRSPDRDIEGTVEKIGMRLTRIRTFDQRPLYVPNSIFSNTTVENPQRMWNRRIFETIGIRYEDVSKMAVILQDVEQMLRGHPEIDTAQTMMVNFTTFGSSSLDFFIYTFTKTTNWEHYHKVKQDVLFRVTEIIETHGAQIAFPTSTVHVPNGLPLRQVTAE